jgi:hypothetical protein
MDVDLYIDILYYFDLKLYLVFCSYELQRYWRSILCSPL